jgi:hypothetical protein
MAEHVLTESTSIVVGVPLNMEVNFAKLSQWCWDSKCTHKHHHANTMIASMVYALHLLEVMDMSVNVHPDLQEKDANI